MNKGMDFSLFFSALPVSHLQRWNGHVTGWNRCTNRLSRYLSGQHCKMALRIALHCQGTPSLTDFSLQCQRMYLPYVARLDAELKPGLLTYLVEKWKQTKTFCWFRAKEWLRLLWDFVYRNCTGWGPRELLHMDFWVLNAICNNNGSFQTMQLPTMELRSIAFYISHAKPKGA